MLDGIGIARGGQVQVHANGVTISIALSPSELRAFARQLEKAAERMESQAAETVDGYLDRAADSAKEARNRGQS